jgi:hypothetical protein
MIRASVRSPIVIGEITDPEYIARFDAQRERSRRNSKWLQSHWPDVLPQVRGKFLAVAGQEPFIADTAGEALRLARAAHPDDDGVLLQYVRSELGPRIYAHRG